MMGNHISLPHSQVRHQAGDRRFSLPTRFAIPSPRDLMEYRKSLGRRVSLTGQSRRSTIRHQVPADAPLDENLTATFQLNALHLHMEHNLCGCERPLIRVDLVAASSSPTSNASERQLCVDRRVGCPEDEGEEKEGVKHELLLHSYLAGQYQSQHDGLVRLYGHFEQYQTHHILTEWYPLGSLKGVLDFKAELQTSNQGTKVILPFFEVEENLRQAVRQICSAVAFIHKQGVAHLDLALENIYVDVRGGLHVGDFRYGYYVGTKSPQRRLPPPSPVRPEYAAPELYMAKDIDLFKADAWSLGIVLFTLITKQTPVDETTITDPKFRLLQVLGFTGFLERLRSESP